MVLEEDFNGVTDIASWVSEEFFVAIALLIPEDSGVDCETGPRKWSL